MPRNDRAWEELSRIEREIDHCRRLVTEHARRMDVAGFRSEESRKLHDNLLTSLNALIELHLIVVKEVAESESGRADYFRR